MPDLPISVAIITRQRRADVIKAVESALAEIGPDDSVIVLENGCPDDSTAGLEDRYPTVRWERITRNLGVSGGRNRLIELTSTPIILFLDDDAVLHEGAVASVRRHLVESPQTGIVAMRMDEPKTRTPRSHEFPAKDKTRYEAAFETTYFIGGAFAVRRDALRESGTFDDWLFYGLEELDLSYRMLDAGWRIWYLPDARTTHHAVTAGRPSGQYFYYHVRNRFHVALRRLPWRFAISQIVAWTGYFALQAVKAGQLRHFGRGVAAGLRDIPAAVRTRAPIRPDTVRHLRALDGRLLY